MNYPELYRKLLDYYARLSSFLPKSLQLPPLHVLILLTHRCNIKCKMCPFLEYHHAPPGNNRELGLSEIQKIVDQSAKFSLITFTGGEVFVRKDFLDILSYAIQKRKCSIITNGSLITKEKAAILAKMGSNNLFGKGLSLIGVSVEGPKSFHDNLTGLKGSYERTRAGLRFIIEEKKKLNKKFPLINIQTVISPETIPHLEGIYNMADEIGVDMCNFALINTNIYHRELGDDRKKGLEYQPEIPAVDYKALKHQLDSIENLSKRRRVQVRFSPSGLTSQEIIRYFKGESKLSKYSCFGPWSKIQIDPYGDVLVCPFFKAGNLREQDFETIWRNTISSNFRKKLKNEGLFRGCLGCCMLTYFD